MGKTLSHRTDPRITTKTQWLFFAENRRRLGLRQASIAAALGVTQSQVSDWERGSKSPSIADLAKLSALFGIGIGELAERSDIFFEKRYN